MSEFKMPSLGADMEAGVLRAWRKKPGERVKRGDLIADVESDKGIIEVEAFEGGILEKILVEPGTKVPVGTPLAIIRGEGESAAPAAAPAAVPATDGRIKASPAARQISARLGVDLAAVRGTGPGGAVTSSDVELAAEVKAGRAAVPSPAADAGKAARMRQAIAASMSRSKREIPHYYVSESVDMHGALEWMAAENLKRPLAQRLVSGVLLVKAVALAARGYPEMNAFWQDGRAVPSPAVHVGMAISLRGGGLVAPALHDADKKSLPELMEALADLVSRARAGTLRSSEFSDPTITVTSLGERGVESVSAIIIPPQVAIVGFGRISERPWVVDGRIAARPLLTATLSADHRASDAHRGALFLADVARRLREPAQL